MLFAYKFRLYPDAEQKVLIEKTFGCSRFIYNKILADAVLQYKETGKVKIKTPAQYKQEFDWLKEVDSMALCNAQLHVQAAYDRFYKKQNNLPQFHKKGVKDTFTTNNINNSIRIENDRLRLPKIGFIDCVFHRWVQGTIKSCTISKRKSEKYFVSILTEKEEEANKKSIDIENRVGIDASLSELAVLSDGTKAKYPRFYRKYEERLAFLQNKLSKKEKGGSNYLKLKSRIARLHEKIANCRFDFQHNLSHEIVEMYDVIVVENINYKEMAQSLHLGKSVHDIGFGAFRSMLEYKAKWQGKVFILADKQYPSSKLCSVCGTKNEGLRLSEREWTCAGCGTVHDRDINAAINLRNYTGATPEINACGEGSSTTYKHILDETGKVDVMAEAEYVVA